MTNVIPSSSDILPVLKLFVIPVGGGIPAGVMLAHSKGISWPVVAILYLLSDVALALAFEPVLRCLAFICGKIPTMARFNKTLKAASARSVSHFNGTGAGPVTLVMIAFGVDPMTGRASALAAGHGFISGWAIAIAGDMLYFGVIAVTTLNLNSYIRDPDTTMLIVLAAMFMVPLVIRRYRQQQTVGSEG